MAMMEFEFNESGESDGQFMPTGRVIEFLRQHLVKGEIDAAVTLYESCVESVGDQLWSEFESASSKTKKAIANLFFRSRDYNRAARACSILQEWSAAARSFAASYDYANAADCHLKSGDSVRAAKMFEKAGDARRAGELYYKAGRLDLAAGALETAGDLVGAGQLYLRGKQMEKAAHSLSQVSAQDPRYVQAVGLLAEALVHLGRKDLALARLGSAIPRDRPIQDKLTAEIAYRAGKLAWEIGQVENAKIALNRLATFDKNYKDLQGLVARMKTGAGPATPPGPPATTGATPTIEIKAPVHAAATDPFAALDANPFVAKPAPAGPRPQPAQTVATGFVQRMDGYDALKQLPIFEDLSLDEMKAFYSICELAYFPADEILIEQGHSGAGLFIILEGECTVSKIEAGGRQTNLAVLGPGKYVGEMSLVEETPTSARVAAKSNVKVLKTTRERFAQFVFAHDRIALRIYRSFVRTLSQRLREQNARR